MDAYIRAAHRKEGDISYVAASITALLSGQRVILKARGMWIYKAVDVSQTSLRSSKAGIGIGSTSYTKDGESRLVSYIMITLEPTVNVETPQLGRV